jgi:hypothetical protein
MELRPLYATKMSSPLRRPRTRLLCWWTEREDCVLSRRGQILSDVAVISWVMVSFGVFILGGWDIPSTSRYSMRMLGFGGIPVYTPICQQSHCWTVRRFFRDSFMLSSSLQVSCCTQVLMLFAEAEKRRRVAHTRYNEVETWKCEAFASQEAFARAESQSLRQWFCFFILCNVLNPIINHPQCHYK